MFSRILFIGLLVTSIFAAQGLAAPLTDSTELAARGLYSTCISRCVEQYAAGPNRDQCYKKCDKMYPNTQPGRKHRRDVSLTDSTQLEARGLYSTCINRCIEQYAAGPNRDQCYKKCDKMYPNTQPGRKHRRDVSLTDSTPLEARGLYSTCINRCIEQYAAGPNRDQCYKKCDKMYPNTQPGRKHRRDVSLTDSTQLDARGLYSTCISRCVEQYAAGPNRNQCYKKCDKMYPNTQPVRKHRRAAPLTDSSLLEARGLYSACINRCIEQYAAGPNRNQCYKKCDKMYPNTQGRKH